MFPWTPVVTVVAATTCIAVTVVMVSTILTLRLATPICYLNNIVVSTAVVLGIILCRFLLVIVFT